MIKFFLTFFLVLGSFISLYSSDKNSVIEHINKIQMQYSSMEKIIVIDEYEKENKKNSYKMKLLYKDDNSLAIFQEPERQKGKIVLKKGSSHYIYFPKAKKYSRISPRSLLFGNVIIGEIVSLPLSKYYDYNVVDSTSNVVVIEFIAKKGEKPAFHKKVCFYDMEKKELLKIENYTGKDVLFGSSEFYDYKNSIPTKIKITNTINKNSYNIMTTIYEKIRKFPDNIFTPSYLKYVHKL